MKKIYTLNKFQGSISVLKLFLCSCILSFFLQSCSSDGGKPADSTEAAPSDKGIGPVSKVDLGPLDENLAANGKAIFDSKCTACHKMDVKVVGPPLGGVTKRRKPEWIMNMILNPTEMIQKDPIAKELLATYIATMANQNLTQDEARAVLEYFRSHDSK